MFKLISSLSPWTTHRMLISIVLKNKYDKLIPITKKNVNSKFWNDTIIVSTRIGSEAIYIREKYYPVTKERGGDMWKITYIIHPIFV